MGDRVLLKKVRIKNFRSILDETIAFDQFNMFVGLNDCGKSNVLKALNLFFNGETEFGKKFDFKTDYCQNGKAGQGKAKEIIIELCFYLPVKGNTDGEYVWTKTWRIDGLHDDNIDKIFGSYSKGKSFLKRIIFEYIPAVKSGNYFKELLQKMYHAMANSANNALLDANSSYSTTLKTLTSELNKNIKENIGLDSHIQMPNDLGVVFRDMLINTADTFVTNINLDNRGDGIKARYIPSILFFIFQKIIESRKKGEIESTIIWGYEEPENGVEFFACSKLADELYSYCPSVQIMLTTHSPAIYSKNNSENVKCYYVHKDDNGNSKYDDDRSIVELNENIGLMPLIAPYIQDFQAKVDEHNERIRNLNAEVSRLNAMTQKIIIYTEGKTDVKYLKLAFEAFHEYDDVSSRVEYYDIEHACKTGDSELQNICDYLQKGNDTNIKICMFDRDAPNRIKDEEYNFYPNKTYRFNIPIPPHRNISDKIAIEHYLKDEDLGTIDSNGRKIFLAKDFDDVGRSLDGLFFHQHAKAHTHAQYDPLEIINGSEEKRVYSTRTGDNKNYALTKDQFVKHIENHDDGFDFDLSAYKLILDVIKKIVENADRRTGE